MKLWVNVAAVLVILVGAVWTLQGADLIGGSFMSGRSQWLYIGVAMFAAGVGALWWVNFTGGQKP